MRYSPPCPISSAYIYMPKGCILMLFGRSFRSASTSSNHLLDKTSLMSNRCCSILNPTTLFISHKNSSLSRNAHEREKTNKGTNCHPWRIFPTPTIEPIQPRFKVTFSPPIPRLPVSSFTRRHPSHFIADFHDLPPFSTLRSYFKIFEVVLFISL